MSKNKDRVDEHEGRALKLRSNDRNFEDSKNRIKKERQNFSEIIAVRSREKALDEEAEMQKDFRKKIEEGEFNKNKEQQEELQLNNQESQKESSAKNNHDSNDWSQKKANANGWQAESTITQENQDEAEVGG